MGKHFDEGLSQRVIARALGVMAGAILDRLVHNAEIIELTGESMRKHRPARSDKPDLVD